MNNFAEYFLPERRIFLENISYETVETEKSTETRRLGCRDTVVSQLILPVGVKFIFNRRLAFEPEAVFTLSVSFGVMLRFDAARRDEVNWREVNLVQEFTRNFPALLSELSARTTLLAAQITSSAGGVPIVASPPAKVNMTGFRREEEAKTSDPMRSETSNAAGNVSPIVTENGTPTFSDAAVQRSDEASHNEAPGDSSDSAARDMRPDAHEDPSNDASVDMA